MKLTLGEARLSLADYAPASKLNERINRACELLLTLSRPKDFLDRVALTSYDATLTLPRQYSTCVGILRDQSPLPIRNGWVEFVLDGAGQMIRDGEDLNDQIIDIGDGYTCFREPESVNASGCRLKFITDAGANEDTPVELHVMGVYNGDQVRTTSGSNIYFGDKMEMVAGADVTSTKSFDTLTKMIKPVTLGMISVYAIDPDDSSETLIAKYEPGEKLPCYRRYRVPPDPEGASSYVLVALCQRRFVEATDDSDTIAVSNLSALQNAMLHIHYRLENDDERADRTLRDALGMIAGETSKFRPASQYPPMINYIEGGGHNIRSMY